MSDTLTGGCLCGAVRYELKPGFRMKPYACHCTDCQRRTGSAFSCHMLVMEKDLMIAGELDEAEFKQPSGAMSKIIGCSKCKARIYAANSKRPGNISMRVGTMDNSRNMSPAAHFWVSRKQAWISIPDDVPALDTQPQSDAEWLQYIGHDN